MCCTSIDDHVYVVLFTEDEASVSFDEAMISVDEDVASGTFMFCATLTLSDGFTLDTNIIAPFTIDETSTGKI